MEPIREGLFELTGKGRGYLLTNRCERCGTSYFPRREKCITCLESDRLVNTKLAGRGKLYTYTVLYRAAPEFNVPLLVGYVDFEKEGLRVFGQITGCSPEELKIGSEMELVFEKMDVKDKEKEKLVYKFRPVSKETQKR